MRHQRRRMGVLTFLVLALLLLVAPGLVSPAHGQSSEPPPCSEEQVVAVVAKLTVASEIPFFEGPEGVQVFDNGTICVAAVPPGEGGGSQLQCPNEGFTFIALSENEGVCLKAADLLSNVGPLPPADSASGGTTAATFSGAVILAALALLAGGLHWEARRQRSAAPSDRT